MPVSIMTLTFLTRFFTTSSRGVSGGQNQMPGKGHKFGRELCNGDQGEGMTQGGYERVAEDLADSLPGLPPTVMCVKRARSLRSSPLT